VTSKVSQSSGFDRGVKWFGSHVEKYKRLGSGVVEGG
jgi:hypothetical protein